MKVTRRKDGWWLLDFSFGTVGGSNPIAMFLRALKLRLFPPPALLKRPKARDNGEPKE